MANETVADLVAELAKQKIKHTPEEIVNIVRSPAGKIIFLEQGNSRAGLQHIIQAHGSDFVKQGIAIGEIPALLITAVEQNNVLGTQGRSRVIFLVEFKEKVYQVAIQISHNGFIVSANPRSRG